jgi:hypothetical protein
MKEIDTYRTGSDLLIRLNGLNLVALMIDIADKLLESGAVESLGFFHEVSCLGIGVQKEILEPCVDLISELGVVGSRLFWFLYCELCLRTASRHFRGNE